MTTWNRGRKKKKTSVRRLLNLKNVKEKFEPEASGTNNNTTPSPSLESQSNTNYELQINDNNDSDGNDSNSHNNKHNHNNHNHNNNQAESNTLNKILCADSWECKEDLNVNTGSPNKKLRSGAFKGNEIIDTARLNQQFVTAQELHRNNHKACIIEGACVEIRFENGKFGRKIVFVCNKCKEECNERNILEDYVHAIANIDNSKYNTLNIRYAIACAESRVRLRKLKLLQVTLGLPQSYNKTFYRAAKLVDSQKKAQARTLCKRERDLIYKSKSENNYKKSNAYHE